MNPEIFAEWLRRQGYRVIRSSSSYWYEASPRVYQAFPYHWVIQPPEDEILGLLRQHHAIALRYSAPVSSPLGKISYHAIYDQPAYTLEGLDRRSRQNIRTGLKNCSVEPVTFQRLAEEGWCLEEDTAARQGRKPAMDQETWRRRYLAAADLPGFEAWGALVEGRLTASLLTFQIDDWCEFISQQCHHDYLCVRVNNALTYVVTQTMVDRPEINSIFYTIQSLNAPASVDEFKFRMGFVARPIRQRVSFHPLIAPVAIRAAHAMLVRYLKRAPESAFCSRAEGVLRYHLQGNLALEKQIWPECLEESRSEILNAQTVQYQDVQGLKIPVHGY
jgi:hypothetical protein